MDDTTQSLPKIVLWYRLLTGGAIIAYFLLLGLAGQALNANWGVIAGVLLIIGVFLSEQHYRRYHLPYYTYGHAFLLGVGFPHFNRQSVKQL